MPNYELQKKEQQAETPLQQIRPEPEITQEQITKSLSEILVRQMSQSEVELMKAENAELKVILGNFGQNYNKFEDLTKDIIRQNREELLKLTSYLHEKYEKKQNELETSSKQMNEHYGRKLSELKTSNDELNEKIAITMTNLNDNIKKDITSIYEKVDKNATERLQKYNDSIERLERKSHRFWAIEGVKEAMFWCMCLAMLIFVGKAALDVYGINLPVTVWQIVYPCSFIPFVGYVIRVIAGKSPADKQRNSSFGKYK